MSILQETEKPFFYAVVYTTPPKDYQGGRFEESASMLIAMAATEPGYIGYERVLAAEGRTVAVCYWNTYGSLGRWLEKVEGWTPGDPGVDALICTTGCLWPWLMEERRIELETAARSVA
ncbi:MAG: hypothetical protein H8E39_00370 [Alphaproteobacteria bacterium]|nr:hypothetical protein [Alphaproteobacteria bacterium]